MSTLVHPSVEIDAPGAGQVLMAPEASARRNLRVSRETVAAVALLSAVFLATSVYRLNHTDLWAHLSFGRWIVENGRLPSADPFRSFVPGQPFLNVPWLSQVLGYLCHEGLALEGLVFAHALLVTLTAAIMIAAVRARGVSLAWAVAAAAASYILSLPIVGTIRPQLLGALTFAAALYGVARLQKSYRPLFWLPLVFALWANLHGSFPMGLGVLGCYAVAQTLERRRVGAGGKNSERDRCGMERVPMAWRAWAALALGVVGACLNPLGVNLLWAVAGFAGNKNLAGISEWEPMALASLSGGLFFGSLLVTAVLIRLSPRRISVTEVLLVLAFGAASLVAIRMLVWWALVWPWVVAPHAAAIWRSRWAPGPRLENGGSKDPRPARMRLVFAVAIVLATVWWAPPTYAFITRRSRPAEAILSYDTPKALADWLVKQGVSGRTFAPMEWADYLIWRTHGAVEPLVFSHVHLTEPDVWQDFLLIRSGSNSWRTVAARYSLEYLVISRNRNRRLATSAGYDPNSQLLYEDSQALMTVIQK